MLSNYKYNIAKQFGFSSFHTYITPFTEMTQCIGNWGDNPIKVNLTTSRCECYIYNKFNFLLIREFQKIKYYDSI